MGPYDVDDAAEDTGVDESEVREAWHQARQDCRDSDHRDRVERTDDWDKK